MEKISTKDMKQIVDPPQDATVINVLDEDAFKQEHIPGSVNVPVSRPGFLDDVRARVSGEEEKIVVYCADEQCPASENAAQKLESAGYQNVYDYTGGMQAWREAGHEVASA